MSNLDKVIKGLDICIDREPGKYTCNECPYEIDGNSCELNLAKDILVLLKEQRYEYENGFNDAMLGKQELMYEGTDWKWYKKDW